MGINRGGIFVGHVHRGESGPQTLAECMGKTRYGGKRRVFRETGEVGLGKIGDDDRESFVKRVDDCRRLNSKERIILKASRDGKSTVEIARRLKMQTWEIELAFSTANKKLLRD